MFLKPFLSKSKGLPNLPIRRKDFQVTASALTEWSPARLSNPVIYLKDYVLDNWFDSEDLKKVSGSLLPYNRVPEYKMLKSIGLIDRINPHRSQYDHLLIDGGVKPVLDYRLRYLDKLIQGGLKSERITIFGGQKLRKPDDDLGGTLEEQARRLRPLARPWLRNWIDKELKKDPANPDRWKRPFATEHEVSLLALLEWGGKELHHIKTTFRHSPQSIHTSIPVANVAYEDFALGSQSIRVLNALAIRREFIERQLPLEDSRPTGGSCFREWLFYTKPSVSASVLLITHNPDIYRSWLDIMIVAYKSNREDLILEGAGDGIMPKTLYGEVLQSFGRILINFYMIYQVKSSESTKSV